MPAIVTLESFFFDALLRRLEPCRSVRPKDRKAPHPAVRLASIRVLEVALKIANRRVGSSPTW